MGEAGEGMRTRRWESSGQKLSRDSAQVMKSAAWRVRWKVWWWAPRFQHVDTSHCISLPVTVKDPRQQQSDVKQ